MEEKSNQFKERLIEASKRAYENMDFFLSLRDIGVQISLYNYYHKIVPWEEIEFASFNPLTQAMTALIKEAGLEK